MRILRDQPATHKRFQIKIKGCKMLILKKLFTIIPILLFVISTSLVNASNLPEKLLNMPISLTSGEVVTLKQYQGKKPVYLKFWATWCVPCRKQMPHFEHIAKQYNGDLEVIAINLGINDDLAAVEKIQQEFGLSMPMAIDKNGDLAQAFRLLGTPYHLLFDKQMNLVHIGHEADSTLDNKIALISQNQRIDLLADSAISETAAPLTLNLNDGQSHALFFTATWCDWYLKDSRPAVSQQCIKAQQTVNKLSQQMDGLVWQGVISRLWTGDTELAAYAKKYNIPYPTAVDASNQLFHQFAVKDLPTLVIVKNNQVVFSTSDFSEDNSLEKSLSAL